MSARSKTKKGKRETGALQISEVSELRDLFFHFNTSARPKAAATV